MRLNAKYSGNKYSGNSGSQMLQLLHRKLWEALPVRSHGNLFQRGGNGEAPKNASQILWGEQAMKVQSQKVSEALLLKYG